MPEEEIQPESAAAGCHAQVDPWDEPSISFRDLLRILAGRSRTILAASAICGALAIGVALRLPSEYTATAVIMPPQKEQSAATALMGQLGPLAAAAGDMGLKSPSDLYVGLLGSRTIADDIIERFQLRTVYHIKTAEDARAKLRNLVKVTAGKDSLIRIQVKGSIPQRAADMANAFAEELAKMNRRLATTDAGTRRLFLETQLDQERTALSAAEVAMREEQQRSGLIQPDSQTSVAIASVAQLRAQITAGEVALVRLKMGATNQNPELIRQESELEALRGKLRQLESGTDGGPLPSAAALPKAGLEYLRRLRDLKYHELLFELLSKQAEAARLDEVKSGPELQVVDFAVAPDKKSGPPRRLIVAFGVIAGAALSAVAVYALARLRGELPRS